MRKLISCSLAFSLVFMLLSNNADAQKPPFSPPKIVLNQGQSVAFLGASITEQGINSPQGYIRLIVDQLAANRVTIRPIPAGVSGNTSRDMLARLEKDVLSKKPDWVFIDAGGNDVWHGSVGFAEYMSNMTSIVDRCQASGIKVLLQTCTPIGEDLKNEFNAKMAYFNDFQRYLAKQKQCLIADLNAESVLALQKKVDTENELTTDGVHMNERGNRLMADGILKVLGVSRTE